MKYEGRDDSDVVEVSGNSVRREILSNPFHSFLREFRNGVMVRVLEVKIHNLEVKIVMIIGMI